MPLPQKTYTPSEVGGYQVDPVTKKVTKKPAGFQKVTTPRYTPPPPPEPTPTPTPEPAPFPSSFWPGYETGDYERLSAEAKADVNAAYEVWKRSPAGIVEDILGSFDMMEEDGSEGGQFPTDPPPEGYHWAYDSSTLRYVAEPIPGYFTPTPEMSEKDKELLRLAEEDAALAAVQAQRAYELQLAQLEQEEWGMQAATSQAWAGLEQQSWWQQQQIALAEEELAMEGEPDVMSEAEQWQTGFLPSQAALDREQEMELAQQEMELTRERMALEEELAMLPYQGMTASQQAQLEQQILQRESEIDFAHQQLAQEFQIAQMPYGGMTAAQQAELEFAQMPYEQMTMQQQSQAELQQQEIALAKERMDLEEQLAMLPYQGMTASQQAQVEQQILQREAELDIAYRRLEQELQMAQMPYEGMTAQQQSQAELQRQQLTQEMELARLPYESMTQYQEAMMEQQQQAYLSQLAAQPHSWLEYSAMAGTQPVVQPWMLPLMPQEYSQLGAGAPIPGYQGTAGMTGMPELTSPSRQYQARMGPTSGQQWLGYQQAQQGIRPEEQMWRSAQTAPPSGQHAGLTYGR